MDKKTQKVMFSSDRGDHRTPEGLFNLLYEEFFFDCDVAASKDNRLLENYIDEKQDALRSEWGQRNFCNPPYGRKVGRWIEKAMEEAEKGKLSVLLLAGRVGTKWFVRAAETADEIRFIRGRITFEGEPNVAPFPSILIIYYGKYVRGSFRSPSSEKYQWDVWRLR